MLQATMKTRSRDYGKIAGRTKEKRSLARGDGKAQQKWAKRGILETSKLRAEMVALNSRLDELIRGNPPVTGITLTTSEWISMASKSW